MPITVSFPGFITDTDNKKLILSEGEREEFLIDDETINYIGGLLFQRGEIPIGNDEKEEVSFALIPPVWFSYQTQILMRELQLHRDYDVQSITESLWKIVTAKWLGIIVSFCLLERVESDHELPDEVRIEYNKHIRYAFRDGVIKDYLPSNGICELLLHNLDRLNYWHDKKIISCMMGESNSIIRVPDWGSLLNLPNTSVLKCKRHPIKCISICKQNESNYFFAINGIDDSRSHPDSGNKMIDIDLICQKISQSGNGATPIRCQLTADVRYFIGSTPSDSSITYGQYSQIQVDSKYNRLFTCSERKIMEREGASGEIGSTMKPCYMCLRSQKQIPGFILRGIMEEDDTVLHHQQEYDEKAKEIMNGR